MRSDAHFRPARAGMEAAPRLPGFFPVLNGEWADAANEDTLRPLDVVSAHLRTPLQRRMGGFLGLQETSNLFGKVQREYADPVKEVLRVVAPQAAADLLRQLAHD